ncbi:MAG: tetratricopeptide repeat protein [Acidobacteriota bacterium]
MSEQRKPSGNIAKETFDELELIPLDEAGHQTANNLAYQHSAKNGYTASKVAEDITWTKYKIALQDVLVTSEGEAETRVHVSLTLGNRTEHNERVGSNEMVLTLIASATLAALNQLLPKPLDVKLDYIKMVTPQLNTPATILSLFRLRQVNKEVFLNGSSPLLDNLHRTAARSVLDALNRTIERALEQSERREQIASRSGEQYIAHLAQLSSIVDTGAQSKSNESTATNTREDDVTTAALKMERAQLLVNDGQLAAHKGNYELAISCYEQAIALTSENPRYHHLLGLALSRIPQRSKEAEDAYLRALALNPAIAACHVDLGLLYKERGWLEQARTKFQDALAIDRDEARAKTELTLLLTAARAKISTKTGALEKEIKLSGLQKLQAIEISLQTLLICIGALVVLVGIGLAGSYFYSWLTITTKVPESAYQENPNLKAVKIVQDAPSSTNRLSIHQLTDQFIKDQKISVFYWWAAPDKISGKHAVMFVFTQNGEERMAIWLVDLEKNSIKPDNLLAKSFSHF